MSNSFVPPEKILAKLDELEYSLKNGQMFIHEKFISLKQMIQLETELQIAHAKSRQNIDINVETNLPHSVQLEINDLHQQNESLINKCYQFELELIDLFENHSNNRSGEYFSQITSYRADLAKFISAWHNPSSLIETDALVSYLKIRSYLDQIVEFQTKVKEMEKQIQKAIFNDYRLNYTITEDGETEKALGTIQMCKTVDASLLDVTQIFKDNRFNGKINFDSIQLLSNGFYLVPFCYEMSKNTLVILLNPSNKQIEKVRTFDKTTFRNVKVVDNLIVIFGVTEYAAFSFHWTLYILNNDLTVKAKKRFPHKPNSCIDVVFLTANKQNIYLKNGKKIEKYDYSFNKTELEMSLIFVYSSLNSFELVDDKWIILNRMLLGKEMSQRKNTSMYDALNMSLICSIRSNFVLMPLKVFSNYLINLSVDRSKLIFYDINNKLESSKRININLQHLGLIPAANFNYFVNQKDEIVFVK